VDLRGHGASEVPSAGYTIGDYVCDLVGLLDFLGIDRAIMVGHSFAGLVGAVLAIEHSDRVSALIEVDPAYGFEPAWPAAFVEIADAIDETGSAAVLPGLEALEGPSTPAALRCWHARTELRMTPRVLSESIRDWAKAAGVVQRDESVAYLRRRRCPVLACYADPERLAWEEASFTAPCSRAVAFENAGHWLFQEHPEKFTRTVLDWTADIAQRSPAHDSRLSAVRELGQVAVADHPVGPQPPPELSLASACGALRPC
jgi:pimeloyl-ACP methyl ester carboxylesterase